VLFSFPQELNKLKIKLLIFANIKCSSTPISTANLGKMDSGHLKGADHLIEAKTIGNPSLGL